MKREIINFENTFSKEFSNYIENKSYILYYNTKNLNSHDSNHCVVIKYCKGIDKIIDEIINLYRQIGVTPRFYQSYNKRVDKELIRLLVEKKFKFNDDVKYFYHFQGSKGNKPTTKVRIKRINEYTDLINKLFLSDPEEGVWSPNTIKNKLKSKNYILIGGFLDAKLVSIASLQTNHTLTRVDDVFTHYDYRNNGYATAVLFELIQYFKRNLNNYLYLYTSNVDAIKIYEKIGFRKICHNFVSWNAYL